MKQNFNDIQGLQSQQVHLQKYQIKPQKFSYSSIIIGLKISKFLSLHKTETKTA